MPNQSFNQLCEEIQQQIAEIQRQCQDIIRQVRPRLPQRRTVGRLRAQVRKFKHTTAPSRVQARKSSRFRTLIEASVPAMMKANHPQDVRIHETNSSQFNEISNQFNDTSEAVALENQLSRAAIEMTGETAFVFGIPTTRFELLLHSMRAMFKEDRSNWVILLPYDLIPSFAFLRMSVFVLELISLHDLARLAIVWGRTGGSATFCAHFCLVWDPGVLAIEIAPQAFDRVPCTRSHRNASAATTVYVFDRLVNPIKRPTVKLLHEPALAFAITEWPFSSTTVEYHSLLGGKPDVNSLNSGLHKVWDPGVTTDSQGDDEGTIQMLVQGVNNFDCPATKSIEAIMPSVIGPSPFIVVGRIAICELLMMDSGLTSITTFFTCNCTPWQHGGFTSNVSFSFAYPLFDSMPQCDSALFIWNVDDWNSIELFDHSAHLKTYLETVSSLSKVCVVELFDCGLVPQPITIQALDSHRVGMPRKAVKCLGRLLNTAHAQQVMRELQKIVNRLSIPATVIAYGEFGLMIPHIKSSLQAPMQSLATTSQAPVLVLIAHGEFRLLILSNGVHHYCFLIAWLTQVLANAHAALSFSTVIKDLRTMSAMLLIILPHSSSWYCHGYFLGKCDSMEPVTRVHSFPSIRMLISNYDNTIESPFGVIKSFLYVTCERVRIACLVIVTPQLATAQYL